jgi:YfiH family protein
MSRQHPARVEETLQASEVPIWTHPEWASRFPWLVQGTTGSGEGAEPFDLGLFGSGPVGAVVDRWRRLRLATGMRASVHARQLHWREIAHHHRAGVEGLVVMEGYDGHLTDAPGLLLAVSVADCVPIFLVDPDHRAIGAVHAGWRGTAAGVLEQAIARMGELFETRPGEVHLHCGPAICGECYEVGPEVHAAVNPSRPPPEGPAPIDLRAALLERAAALGIAPERSSVSTHCTRCGPGYFFSHRAGSPARQMGVLGLRE